MYSYWYLIIDQLLWWPVREFTYYLLPCVYSWSTVIISITSRLLDQAIQFQSVELYPSAHSRTVE